MNKKKHRILAYSYFFQKMFLSKDIFLIPYYLKKELNGDMTYYYSHSLGNTDIPSNYRGTEIKSVGGCKNEFLQMLYCIVLHALSIDVLFLNGSSLSHMIVVWLYKHIKRNGKVVVFGDMEPPQARELNENEFKYSGGIKGKIKEFFVDYFFNNIVYCVANTEAYNEMKDLCERKGWKGLLHFYPCLDDELFHSYGLKRKSFAEKENIIICVGRIGNYQKNTEMLLDALKSVDLKDWKIYMIGPITSSFDLKEEGDFQKKIDAFFEECPQHKDKLIFTGMIYDMKEVFEYYNRAKVLLLTSRHEGFANVYSQGAALGCYIMSTEVGGADVASNNWHYGYKLQQEDSEGLAAALHSLVYGSLVPNEAKSYHTDEMNYSYRVNRILLPKMGFVPNASTRNI